MGHVEGGSRWSQHLSQCFNVSRDRTGGMLEKHNLVYWEKNAGGDGRNKVKYICQAILLYTRYRSRATGLIMLLSRSPEIECRFTLKLAASSWHLSCV